MNGFINGFVEKCAQYGVIDGREIAQLLKIADNLSNTMIDQPGGRGRVPQPSGQPHWQAYAQDLPYVGSPSATNWRPGTGEAQLQERGDIAQRMAGQLTRDPGLRARVAGGGRANIDDYYIPQQMARDTAPMQPSSSPPKAPAKPIASNAQQTPRRTPLQ